MSNFYGEDKKRSYFEGWYFKQSSPGGMISFIPAFHVNKKGAKSASLQIITDEKAYNIRFPIEDFYAGKNKFLIKIDKNSFSKKGCSLDLKMRGIHVKGTLTYENIVEPRYDIMGPFKFVPFMECRHKVISLTHQVSGQITINNDKYKFSDDLGYIEGDRGTSFPSSYFWTQSNWGNISVMVSIADIPFLRKSFTGCIGFVYVDGKEYRLATYLGVRILRLSKECVCLSQGNLKLFIYLIEEDPKELCAPEEGTMSRTIHESPSCKARYQFRIGNRVIFDNTSQNASFEWCIK